MSTADGDASTGEGPAKKKKGKMLLVLPVVILALAGGGYVMMGGGSKPAAAAGGTTPTGPTTTTMLANASIAKFDDITLNLADGHYLKVGIALQLTKKAVPDDYTTGGSAAKAFDLTISTFGSKTYAELGAPGGREATKAVLQRAIVKAYAGEVSAVYLTDFVMQ